MAPWWGFLTGQGVGFSGCSVSCRAGHCTSTRQAPHSGAVSSHSGIHAVEDAGMVLRFSTFSSSIVIAIASCASTTLRYMSFPPRLRTMFRCKCLVQRRHSTSGWPSSSSQSPDPCRARRWLADGLARVVTPQAPAIAHPLAVGSREREWKWLSVLEGEYEYLRYKAVQKPPRPIELGSLHRPRRFPAKTPEAAQHTRRVDERPPKNWKQNIALYDLYPLSVLSCRSKVRC